MGQDNYLPLEKSGQSVMDRNLPYRFLRGQPFKPLKNFKVEQFSKNLTHNPFYSSLIKSNLFIWARSLSLGGRKESNFTLYKGTCHTKADALMFLRFYVIVQPTFLKWRADFFIVYFKFQFLLTFLGLSDPTGFQILSSTCTDTSEVMPIL